MVDSGWLDEAQQREWRAYVEGSALLLEVRDRRLRSKHNVSLADFEILVRLSEAPEGRLRMADLAELAYYSRSRLSHTVARLETRQLVQRSEDDEDRRGVVASLTETGRAVLEKAARDNVQTVREHFVDVLSPAELETVGRAFRKVADKLRESAAGTVVSQESAPTAAGLVAN